MQLIYSSQPGHISTCISPSYDHNVLIRSFDKGDHCNIFLYSGNPTELIHRPITECSELYLNHIANAGRIDTKVHLDTPWSPNSIASQEQVLIGLKFFSSVDSILTQPSIENWKLRSIQITPKNLHFYYTDPNNYTVAVTLTPPYSNCIAVLPHSDKVFDNSTYCEIYTYTDAHEITFYVKNANTGKFIRSGRIAISQENDRYVIREYYALTASNDELFNMISPIQTVHDHESNRYVNYHVYDSHFRSPKIANA